MRGRSIPNKSGRDPEYSLLSTGSVCKLGRTCGQARLEPTGQPSMGIWIHSGQSDLETVTFHPRILRSIRLRDSGKGKSEVHSQTQELEREIHQPNQEKMKATGWQQRPK